MKKILIFLVFMSTNSFSKEEFFHWGTVANTCDAFLDLAEGYDQFVEDFGDDQLISAEDYFTAAFQAYLSGLNAMYSAIEDKWRNLNFNDEEYLYYYMKNACSRDVSASISGFLIDYYIELPLSSE